MANVILSRKQREELLSVLQARFEKNMNLHKGLAWAKVREKLETNNEKLLFLFEKFIKCLVDYVLFVRIPVVEFGLAPRNPFGESDRRGLHGIRNPHRSRHPHQLLEQLLGQIDFNLLAQSVFPANLRPSV